jgi:hypothetical protein
MQIFITMNKKLKQHFLDAVISGGIGKRTENGLVITTKEFVQYFEDKLSSKNNYLRSYLPSVSIEAGRHEMNHNKFLFKIGRGIYKIHEDAINSHSINRHSTN